MESNIYWCKLDSKTRINYVSGIIISSVLNFSNVAKLSAYPLNSCKNCKNPLALHSVFSSLKLFRWLLKNLLTNDSSLLLKKIKKLQKRLIFFLKFKLVKFFHIFILKAVKLNKKKTYLGCMLVNNYPNSLF